MQSLRLAVLTTMLIVSGYAAAIVEDNPPVPPVYVGPDNDDQVGPDHPAVHCEGVDCLPPEVNEVEECKGKDCTPAPPVEPGLQTEQVQ
jgi:hypothetical protein